MSNLPMFSMSVQNCVDLGATAWQTTLDQVIRSPRLDDGQLEAGALVPLLRAQQRHEISGRIGAILRVIEEETGDRTDVVTVARQVEQVPLEERSVANGRCRPSCLRCDRYRRPGAS